jgi:hypothetical protein
VYLLMVLAAARTNLSAAEAPLETAAHFKAGAATLPPTVATTVSLTLEPAVLLLTSQPTASVARMAKFAWALASAIAAPVLDGAVTRRNTAQLDVRLASATVLSPTLEMCLSTASAERMERLAKVAHTETAVLLKASAEKMAIAVQVVRLLSAPAMLTLAPSPPTAAVEASMGSPARAVHMEAVAPKVVGAASSRSTVTLAVRPSSVLATAQPAKSPLTAVVEASTARSAKEVRSAIAVPPKAIAVDTISAMRAAKMPSVPAKIARTTSPLMGAVARTGKPAREARSGTVALSMDGVEKGMISVAMDVNWLTAFALASPRTRNVVPGTERLVQDPVWETVARRAVSVELLTLTVARAVRRVLRVLA